MPNTTDENIPVKEYLCQQDSKDAMFVETNFDSLGALMFEIRSGARGELFPIWISVEQAETLVGQLAQAIAIRRRRVNG